MDLRDDLLRWFSSAQRPLPWRKNYDPYRVWISEIMLQQTQMDTVLPYYERWMRRFPDIRSLAQAETEEILKAWEGLGYYSRARNLHATARRIVEEFGGRFPADYESIRSLKGVGPYTAGAIASIAFNQERPLVDGNVVRVLSRLFASRLPFGTAEGRRYFWDLEERLIPKGRARDFNQALMELGALVCRPLGPDCASCPVRAHCRAYAQGEPEAYPVKSRRKEPVRVEAAAVVVRSGGRYFIRRRPEGAIMGGLWEFPEWKLSKDKPLAGSALRKKAAESIADELGLDLKLEPLSAIKRSYTHHLETLHVFRADLSGGAAPKPKSAWPHAWVTPRQFARHPFSSAHAKITKLL
jgi:A/G-specific adenine glycosylase